jgi:phosphonate transport system substrate-binding protein
MMRLTLRARRAQTSDCRHGPRRWTDLSIGYMVEHMGFETRGWRLGFIVAVALLVLACRDLPMDEVAVDPSTRTQTTSLAPPSAALKFAVAAMVTPETTYQDYALLFRELGAQLGTPVAVVHGRSYRSVNDQLVSGKLDAAFICTGGYLELLERDKAPAILAVPVVNAETVYRSVIIVKRASRYQSFKDLRGSRFAFTDPLSNTGYLYPNALLKKLGSSRDAFFSSYAFLKSHDRAIHAVTGSLRDAAAVDSLIFDFMTAREPKLARDLRVIHRSPPFGIPPVVAGLHTTTAQHARWRAALLALAKRKRAKATMKRLRIDRFSVPPPGLYDATRKLYAETR